MGITSVDDCWEARDSLIYRSSAYNRAGNPFVWNTATTDGKAGRLWCFNWAIETERNLTKWIYKAALKGTKWERPIKRFKAIKSWARIATCYYCYERERWIEKKRWAKKKGRKKKWKIITPTIVNKER